MPIAVTPDGCYIVEGNQISSKIIFRKASVHVLKISDGDIENILRRSPVKETKSVPIPVLSENGTCKSPVAAEPAKTAVKLTNGVGAKVYPPKKPVSAPSILKVQPPCTSPKSVDDTLNAGAGISRNQHKSTESLLLSTQPVKCANTVSLTNRHNARGREGRRVTDSRETVSKDDSSTKKLPCKANPFAKTNGESRKATPVSEVSPPKLPSKSTPFSKGETTEGGNDRTEKHPRGSVLDATSSVSRQHHELNPFSKGDSSELEKEQQNMSRTSSLNQPPRLPSPSKVPQRVKNRSPKPSILSKMNDSPPSGHAPKPCLTNGESKANKEVKKSKQPTKAPVPPQPPLRTASPDIAHPFRLRRDVVKLDRTTKPVDLAASKPTLENGYQGNDMRVPEAPKLKQPFKIPRRARTPTPPPVSPVIPTSPPKAPPRIRIDLSIKDKSYFQTTCQVESASSLPVVSIQDNKNNPPLCVLTDDMEIDDLDPGHTILSEDDSEVESEHCGLVRSPSTESKRSSPASSSRDASEESYGSNRDPPTPCPAPKKVVQESEINDNAGSIDDMDETSGNNMEVDDDADVLDLFVNDDEFDF